MKDPRIVLRRRFSLGFYARGEPPPHRRPEGQDRAEGSLAIANDDKMAVLPDDGSLDAIRLPVAMAALAPPGAREIDAAHFASSFAA